MSKKILLAFLPLLALVFYYPMSAQVFSLMKNIGTGQFTAGYYWEQPDNGNMVFTWYQDSDGDGYGNPDESTTTPDNTAPDGYVADNTDCYDGNANYHPGAVWYKDFDGDMYSDGTTAVNCEPPSGYYPATDLTSIADDCNDDDAYIHPGFWYLDFDFDGYGGGDSVWQCERPNGIPSGQYWKRAYELVATTGDCNDEIEEVHPNADERCGNGFDNNCNGLIDEDCGVEGDTDGDGFTTANGDCNDSDSGINPGAAEVCGNGIDDNCDGQTDEGCNFETDADGDGYKPSDGDCNDSDPNINPGNTEICFNGIDDNCDGQIDEGCNFETDFDGDGFKPSEGDCNDDDANINPSVAEVCDNGIDDNCDGQVDEGCDQDGDGYTEAGGDCDDHNAAINPGATEICGNDVDENCNNLMDEDCVFFNWYEDADSDGFGNPEIHMITYENVAPTGYVADNTDCDDTNEAINPTSVWYLNVDEDGDGYSPGDAWVGCTPPAVGSWVLSTEAGLLGGGDCDDWDAIVYPGIWYLDFDHDGYGTGISAEQCAKPTIPSGEYWKRASELYATTGDCNDENTEAYPTANEICGNGWDDNCNGLIDEECGIEGDTDGDGTLDINDCAPSDPNKWRSAEMFKDTDSDGYYVSVGEVCYGAELPEGYELDGFGTDDCDDNNSWIYVSYPYYVDNDGDGVGSDQVVEICVRFRENTPEGYAQESGDCDDNDPLVQNTCGECPDPTNRLYVNAAANVSGNGGTWQCAIKELRDAVAIANSNNTITEIWVAKGTYMPTAGTDRTASITITRTNLSILGGFLGNEANASAADPIANQTSISGDIGIAGNLADNSFHILRITGLPKSSNKLKIDGFSVEKGNANDPGITSSWDAYGGGALVHENYSTTPISISRCVFGGNNASSAGGALGIYKSAAIKLDSCLFISNMATYGGAIGSYQSKPVFTSTLFKQNTATNGSGGAIISYNGALDFTSSAFDQNTATVSGGAIHQQESNAKYYQSVFSKNTSASGGAIFAQQSLVELTNSTVFANSASSIGGAVAINGTTSGSHTVRNSIFWKNKKATAVNVAGADIAFVSGSVTGNYQSNILQAGTSIPADNGTTINLNKRGVDPLFVSESSPSGPDGYFILSSDGLDLNAASPAINAGENTYTKPGKPDILSRNRQACGLVDMGAYEKQGCATPIVGIRPAPIETVGVKIEASVTNPFRNSLLIRYTGAEKADVEISSLNGQNVWKGSAIQKGQTQVNTSSWPSGLYQVTIRTATQKPIVLKVIKAQ